MCRWNRRTGSSCRMAFQVALFSEIILTLFAFRNTNCSQLFHPLILKSFDRVFAGNTFDNVFAISPDAMSLNSLVIAPN